MDISEPIISIIKNIQDKFKRKINELEFEILNLKNPPSTDDEEKYYKKMYDKKISPIKVLELFSEDDNLKNGYIAYYRNRKINELT